VNDYRLKSSGAHILRIRVDLGIIKDFKKGVMFERVIFT
jgi:hypothetical protein